MSKTKFDIEVVFISYIDHKVNTIGGCAGMQRSSVVIVVSLWCTLQAIYDGHFKLCNFILFNCHPSIEIRASLVYL